MNETCRCGGIGICKVHPERYVDGRYVGGPSSRRTVLVDDYDLAATEYATALRQARSEGLLWPDGPTIDEVEKKTGRRLQ